MIVNKANLDLAFRGFKGLFSEGRAEVPNADQWRLVAEEVRSDTAEELYGWLRDIPAYRKWVGDRVINRMQLSGFSVRNEDWENTVSVDTNSLEDDRLGVLAPRFRMMGRADASFRAQLVFPALKDGFTTLCWDGQYFFDTDHPVLAGDGTTTTSVANTDGGSGTPWYLLCSRAMGRPLIFQSRKDVQFEQLTPDELVKRNREIEYGGHKRAAVAYGFWQTIWGSKQTLDATHFGAAYTGLAGMRGDYGRPLGNVPDTLLVPPSLLTQAMQVVDAERNGDGSSNIWYKKASVVMVPWL